MRRTEGNYAPSGSGFLGRLVKADTGGQAGVPGAGWKGGGAGTNTTDIL